MRSSIPHREQRPFENTPIHWPANVPRSPVQCFVAVESCYVPYDYARIGVAYGLRWEDVVFGLPDPVGGFDLSLGYGPHEWASLLTSGAIQRGTDDVPVSVTISEKQLSPVPIQMLNAVGRPMKGQQIFAFQSQGVWYAFGSYNSLIIGAYKTGGTVYVPGFNGEPFTGDGAGWDVWPYSDFLGIVPTAIEPAEFSKIVLEWSSRELFLYPSSSDSYDTEYDYGFYIPTWIECTEV